MTIDWVTVTVGKNWSVPKATTERLLQDGYGVYLVGDYKGLEKIGCFDRYRALEGERVRHNVCTLNVWRVSSTIFGTMTDYVWEVMGLVNCAEDFPEDKTFGAMYPVLKTNILVPYFLTSEFADYRRIRNCNQSGIVVNIGNVTAFEGESSKSPIYDASKAALHRLNKAMAKEFTYNLHLNLVNMSPEDTPEEIAEEVSWIIKGGWQRLHSGQELTPSNARNKSLP